MYNVDLPLPPRGTTRGRVPVPTSDDADSAMRAGGGGSARAAMERLLGGEASSWGERADGANLQVRAKHYTTSPHTSPHLPTSPHISSSLAFPSRCWPSLSLAELAFASLPRPSPTLMLIFVRAAPPLQPRVLTRAAAVAERLWSGEKSDIDIARQRLASFRCRLVRRGLHASPTLPDACAPLPPTEAEAHGKSGRGRAVGTERAEPFECVLPPARPCLPPPPSAGFRKIQQAKSIQPLGGEPMAFDPGSASAGGEGRVALLLGCSCAFNLVLLVALVRLGWAYSRAFAEGARPKHTKRE